MILMVVHFAFLFHIYQPPVQIPSVLKQIVNESYRPIINAVKENPKAKITLNINATLTEQLADYGYQDVIDGIINLAAHDQLEFTGSGKFHPILPLIPEPEVYRQIKLNYESNRHFFGKVYQPKGFFPPEMAVSEEIFDPIKKTGHDWCIMSGIANSLPYFPTTSISPYKNKLNLVFRDDYLSIDCAFDKVNTVAAFVDRLYYKRTSEDYYVILAMDGETFGHHVKHAINNFLIPLFKALPNRQDVKLCTVSEIVEKFPKKDVQTPKASSWSTMQYDLDKNVPFPLWFDPNNKIHIEQHKFFMYALTMIGIAEKTVGSMNPQQKDLYNNARNFLDRGIHSCQQWWASKRPWYSPDMILRGLNEVLLAVINANRSLPIESGDIPEAFDLILKAMLQSQNEIILSLK